jgi:FAD/FMN-containing dehydrogenase/Fe-S oxidoreductase
MPVPGVDVLRAAERPASGVHRRDVRGLEEALARRVRGDVRFDPGSQALYATTGSNYRSVPLGVVLPRDVEDVVAAVAVCREFGAPIVGRGAGTSLAGQTTNTAVVLDMSKYMNRVLEIDPDRRIARVQPGAVLDTLRDAASRHRLTFAPDPSTHAWCTLGGMIGNNSCGVHSVTGGRTSDNVESLDVLTSDGQRAVVGATSDARMTAILAGGGRLAHIYRGLRALAERYEEGIRTRFPKIPRRVSGYALDELLPEHGFHVARALAGSEGTCAITLEATLRLLPDPPCRVLLVLGYPDIVAAADSVPSVLEANPQGLEGMDDLLVRDMRRTGLHADYLASLPQGGGWLLVEFGGETAAEAAARAQALLQRLHHASIRPSARLLTDPEEQHKLWVIRESGLGATAHVPGQPPTWEGWEDAAVPIDKLGAYLRDFRRLLQRFGYHGDLYGHFGGGCVHTRIDFDLRTREGISRFRAFVHEAADLVVGYGGSLSGEHGDGQARGELLPKMFGDEVMDAFRAFKRLWDPDGLLNPGKLIDARPLDANLRLGPDFQPTRVKTHFAYPQDDGDFARTVLRCVGVGACRKTASGTMCPSYMATREEMHSTRGRAHLLFEMLRNDVVTGGWRDPHVKEALDLCLACKGCKGECPVSVDMATYKAEFLARYYEHRLRPLFAYATGLMPWGARVAAAAPAWANLVTQRQPLANIVRWAGGFALERRLPAFAANSFRRWFAARQAGNRDGRPVLLWADTFNNYFHPETAIAATEVLEAQGCRVEVPQASLCCGRPLYDHGMLGLAKRQLRRIVSALAPAIDAGVPIVVLEPSCAAVFRDELPGLLPGDARARRLRTNVHTLAEFLARTEGPLPRLSRRAIVHGHCHQKSVLGMDADRAVLGAIGLDYELVDSGCCGLAGAFGFDRRHYEVSMAVGERVLLPAVRRAAADTLVIADGFSCREQIAHGTGRRARHLAEVIRLAMAEARGEQPPAAARPPVVDPAPAIALGLTAAGFTLAAVLARRFLPSRATR